MDFLSHFLTGKALAKKYKNKVIVKGIIVGSLFPDIGEIFIQIALSKKYGESFGVYDDRTSDIEIASNIEITFLYDLFHSIPFIFIVFLWGILLKSKKGKFFKGFSIGLLSHLALDFWTHGHIWALKIFFPIYNERIKILPTIVGNWWDWTPKIRFPLINLDFPIYCAILWLVLLFFINYNKDEKT